MIQGYSHPEKKKKTFDFEIIMNKYSIDWGAEFISETSEGSQFNLIQTLCDVLSHHILHSETDTALESLLHLLRKRETGSRVPKTAGEFNNLIRSMVVEVRPQAYDCCVNGCMCFYGSYLDERSCPFCHENRWNDDMSPRNVRKKGLKLSRKKKKKKKRIQTQMCGRYSSIFRWWTDLFAYIRVLVSHTDLDTGPSMRKGLF